jgi:uncharacterized protein YndB with AHSA1/START domain
VQRRGPYRRRVVGTGRAESATALGPVEERMSAARARRQVGAPIDRVWKAATDPAGATARLSAVESVERLTDGPFGVGTRWRETRVSDGERTVEELVVVESDPPRRFVLEVHGGEAVALSTTTLSAAGPDATLVETTLETTPPSVAGRVVGAMLGVLAARAVLATLHRDLDDLAHWCERQEDTGR